MSSDGLESAGRLRRRLPDRRDEGGQILVITGVALVLMLCCVGLVVDVGHAMLVQRQLQAGVDAAALAGVQHLPDELAAETVAMEYSPTPGSKNAVNTVDNATTVAEATCIAGVPGCSRRDGGVNGIVVEASSTVPTWFGRIIGITEMEVSARATACSPCQVKPLDIMIVLDRTGSMCQSAPNTWDANCTDLKNAQAGVETFLSLLDPSLDKVGLALFPPVLDASWKSSCPTQGYSAGDGPSRPGYKPWNSTPNPNVPSGHPARNFNGRYYGFGAFHPYRDLVRLPNIPPTSTPDPQGSSPYEYVVASLEGADGNPADDYLIDDPVAGWILNKPQAGGPGTSALIQRLNCTSGAGPTSYALALEAAQAELSANGRGNVQDVIVFLSDGAANTWPKNLPTGHWTDNWTSWGSKPCATGVEMARRIKQSGTLVYTIGYDLDAGSGAPERCRQPNQSNGQQNGSNPVEVGFNAFTAIQAMASTDALGNPLFYNKPNPGQLNDIFRAIALDLAGSRGRLIDNSSPNLIG